MAEEGDIQLVVVGVARVCITDAHRGGGDVHVSGQWEAEVDLGKLGYLVTSILHRGDGHLEGAARHALVGGDGDAGGDGVVRVGIARGGGV